ncbi:transthyretin family protein [Oleiphilus messinensis]|uniref:5-hydroxyisourate hydrolase n=1 Tax=Oleiphilus messinensis TaxID=141451 RepID=A0A1Y0IED5_9GAMM|nr:hydroxyisourate hydrolase [Oleiphilus messinensis]ARU57734.1 transthyretin family protein [Oleiphilus messinensis]
MSSPITTHVLDTHLGRPAVGIQVTLFRSQSGQPGSEWVEIAQSRTNQDGRITDWLEGQSRETGVYKIEFETDPYFDNQGLTCFYPNVTITFRIQHPEQHYHVPLLISAHGMSTYRGS